MSMRPRWARAFGFPLGIVVGVVARSDAAGLSGRTGLTAWRLPNGPKRVRYFKVGPWVLLFCDQMRVLAGPPAGHPEVD